MSKIDINNNIIGNNNGSGRNKTSGRSTNNGCCDRLNPKSHNILPL
jgi:hypothetical protein